MSDEQISQINERLDKIYTKLFEGDSTQDSFIMQLSKIKNTQEQCPINELKIVVEKIDRKIYLASVVISFLATAIIWVSDKVLK